MTTDTTPRRSGNDMIDAFMYSMEALRIQKARNLRRHKIRMISLAVAAIIIGGLIGWLTTH